MGRGGFGGRGRGGPGRGGFSPGGGGRGMGRGGGFDGRFEDHTTYAVPAEKCGLVIGKGKHYCIVMYSRTGFPRALENMENG